MDAFKKKAFEVTDDVKSAFADLWDEAAYRNNDIQGALDALLAEGELDEHLREFWSDNTISEQAKTSVKAYKDWATNVKGLGKQFNFAKIKAVALNAAMNVFVSMGISLIIQGVVAALDNWIHAQDKVAERAKEFTTNVRQMRDELGSGSKTISDISDRYERLSKGVDKFGRNISLSTSEYNEYKDLVSQVSDIMPDLNVLYDENGQKIAVMAGNMRDLNEQYRVYQQRQADKLLGGSDGQPSLNDWINDYNNTYNNDKLTNQNFWGTAWDTLRGGFGADITDHIPLSTQEDLLRIVLRAQSKQDVFDELDHYTNDGSAIRLGGAQYNALFQAMGADGAYAFSTLSDEDFANLQENAASRLNDLHAKMNTSYEDFRAIIQTLSAKYKTDDTDDELFQQFLNLMPGGDLIKAVQDKDGNISETKVKDITQQIIGLSSSREGQDAISALLDFDTSDSSLSFNDWLLRYDNIIGRLHDLGASNELLAAFDYLTEETGINAQKVQNMLKDKGDFHKLSVKDINLAATLEVPEGTLLSWEELNRLMSEAIAKDVDPDIQAIHDYTEAVKKMREATAAAGEHGIGTTSGNINHFDRPVIEWTDEEIAKQKSALESWGYDTTEFKGTHSFLNGKAANFAETCGVNLAVTPIIKDENGNGVMLDKETLRTYLRTILEKAKGEDGEVDLYLAYQLDAEGLEVDGQKIQNVIGRIDSAANTSTEDLKELTEIWAVYERGIYNLKVAEDELKKSADAANISLGMYIDKVNDARYGDFFALTQDDGKTATTLANISEGLDKVQQAYTTLQSAVKEYNKEGYISVDTLQSVISLGGRYLQYLFDENGNLALNEEALKRVTRARLAEMKAEAIKNVVDTVSSIKNETEAQGYLSAQLSSTASAYTEAAEGALKLWAAQSALSNISPETAQSVIDTAMAQINNINALFDATQDGIDSGFGIVGESASDTSDKIKDANDKIADLNEQLDELAEKQHATELQYDIDKAALALEQFNVQLEQFNTLADLTAEHDFTARLNNVRNRFTTTTQQSLALRDELERLMSIDPQTAEEYDMVASQMESIGNDYFEAVKQQRELRQELLDTKAEALEYLAETASDSASKALDSLNQAFDIVEKGSLSGGLFAQAPTPRVTKDAIERQREENDKLIAEEKRYRDAIADIRKKALEVQHEEDIADIEKERAELNQQIAETQAELSDINVHTNVDPLNTDGLKSDIAATQADLDNNPVRVKVVTEYQTGNSSPTVQGEDPSSRQASSKPPLSIGKATGGAASGNVYVNEGRGMLAGQESMILPDGTFRLIGDGSPTLANVPQGTQILNAQDTADILARTGIKDGDKVERYADGTAKVISRRADNGIVEVRDGKVTAQDFAENTIKEINKAFDDVKDDISLEPVKTEFYQNASDPKFYDNLTQEIDDGIKGSLDEIVKDPENNIYRLILENSDWNALPEQIQSTLGEMGASADGWNEWIQQPDNLLKAMELLRGGDTSSWDLLSPTVQELLTTMGINGVETWNEFVASNPLQALQLLLSSWQALADSVRQWMEDCIAISRNGADAIHAIQIEAPGISQPSWDNLQTLIANKIQEVLNAINETFGNSTVDLNFAINTSVGSSSLPGTEQTNPQGAGGNSGLVSTAEQFLGTPYVWGGTSPAGFDCSGLMQYVFAQNGISIPRTSQEQAGFGTAVGKSELQPGDMVFFNTEGVNSHVGMYIGNGQFIHSPHTGDVVKISDLNSGYYTQHFSCARRVAQYTMGTQDFGIAGENYKPEWAVNKRTGEWSLIKKPTLFNKKEYDIVGEKVSEKIDKPIATYAKGTTSLSSLLGNMFGSKSKSKSASKAQAQSQSTAEDYPDDVTIDVPDGLGKYYTYMNWDTITNMDTLQGQLIQQAGKHYDSEGYGRVGERYALAMTSTFGSIGDYVDVYMANGRIIHGILADEKDQTTAHGTPANMWGHDNGQSIVEFVTNWVGHDNPPGDGGVLKVVNVGNYFGNPSFAGRSVGVDNVLVRKMRELQQKLQALVGTFKTNTHTVTPRVAEYKSLGNVRGKYDFSTPFTKYADGTKPLEVAGENNKPEFLINKRTKKISLIDSPTLIDTGKVDIVGEKDTARLNKSLKFYEEGTLSLSDNDDDENAITAEECATYLKNINDHLEDGVTLNTEMYWDEQLRLISKGIDDLEEDEKISLEQVDQILRFEANFEEFEKSLDEISDSVDHYGKEYTDKWYAEMDSFTEQSRSVTDMMKEWRAGGTAKDTDLRKFDEISNRATELVDGHLRDMINLDIENAKNQVSVLDELANKAQDLYNTASTQDEQERAIEVIEQVREQQEEVNETFVSIMEQEQEWWIGRIERDDLEHTANISWIDKQLDEVGDKLDNATSSLETNTLLQEEKNLYDKKAAEAQRRMDTAHANANTLRNDPEYADLFASIPMDEIFDADGEYNQRYYIY